MIASLLLQYIALPSLVFSAALTKSILFEDSTIISFDEATQTPSVLRNASLLVTNDRIAAIFNSSSNVTIPPGTERIPAHNDIISPGFIDTHRHTWQTVHRTLGSNSTIIEYLFRYSSTALASQIFDADVMYYSQLTGLCEALNSGITSIVDNASGLFTEAIAKAAVNASIDSGMRTFMAYSIREGESWFPVKAQIELFRELGSEKRVRQSLVEMGLAYEGFDGGSTEVVQTVINLARESNISVFETHFVGGVLGTDNSPSRLAQLGFLNETFPIIFIHADGLTPADLTLLRNTNQYISLVPEFELHHGQDIYNPSLALDQASLSVGTHYSTSGDIVSQARIWLQTVRSWITTPRMREFKIPVNNPMSANQAFLLSTRSGGLALRRPDLGVIQVGAKADLAIFDGAAPGMLGWRDPVAALILHSNVGNVKHVLVDGVWKKRDGELLCGTESDLQGNFLKSTRKVQQFWEEMAPTVFEGANPITGAQYVQVDQVDVVRGPLNGY
ncbi:hypothetical protein QQX98_012089 [Neonectria punicea]|uniref:Amidohydrolase-related domain-containing protein n=1 Tax=Neonectria punicea TaxID=979145 RepID=A0ABR1GKA1_9HYPO